LLLGYFYFHLKNKLNNFWIRATFVKKHSVTIWVQNVYYCFIQVKVSIITCRLFVITIIATIFDF